MVLASVLALVLASHLINRVRGTAWYGLGTGLVHPETTIIINGYRVWYTGTPWRAYGGSPLPLELCRLTLSRTHEQPMSSYERL